jgi:2,3-bisphosphoglycerate-dependent phosphoglycerate mutase
MKYILLVAFTLSIVSCSTTKIYLVRHAEKNGTTSNADLKTPEGFTRANMLRDTLQNFRLANVYSTNTPRTIHTAEPTAITQNLQVIIYANGDSLVDKLLLQKNKKFLLVGHSNTIPNIIRHAKLNPGFEGNLADNDFSNFFVIVKKWRWGKEKVRLLKKRYGVQ